jgi:hypothetical protein
VTCVQTSSTEQLTVRAGRADRYFIRVPHWAPHDSVHVTLGGKEMPAVWSGAYVQVDAKKGQEVSVTWPLVRFDQEVAGIWKQTAPTLHVKFHWLGNAVVSSDSPGGATPLFAGRPRTLPPPPAL